MSEHRRLIVPAGLRWGEERTSLLLAFKTPNRNLETPTPPTLNRRLQPLNQRLGEASLDSSTIGLLRLNSTISD